MLGVIVLAAIGLWVFFCVLALSMCRVAKAGDQAMDIACGRYRRRSTDWTVLDRRQARPASRRLELARREAESHSVLGSMLRKITSASGSGPYGIQLTAFAGRFAGSEMTIV